MKTRPITVTVASGNGFHLQRVNRMPKFKNWVYNGKRIKIIDTRISVPDSYVSENVFVSSEFYLAIWDKSMSLDVGCAKQEVDGSYEGIVCYGPHEISISGNTLSELARDAYYQHLWTLSH
jgi:hypothetical protein